MRVRGRETMTTHQINTILGGERAAGEVLNHWLESFFSASLVARSLLEYESHRIVDVNAAWEVLFGFSRDEAAGKTGGELGIWENEQERAKFQSKVESAPQLAGLVFRRRRRDGSPFEALITVEEVVLDARRYRLVAIVDITSQARAQEATDRLAAFFRSSPSAHVIARMVDGVQVEVNNAWERMFGIAREHALGRNGIQLNLWQRPAERAVWLAALTRAGRLSEYPVAFKRSDGSGFNALLSSEIIEIQGVRHFLSSIADVTQQEAAREALERLAKFFMASPAAHAIARLEDGCLTDVNDAWCRMFGHVREEAVGRTTLELGIWSDPRERETFARKVRDLKRVERQPVRSARNGGEGFDALISVEVLDLDGVPHVLVACEDVTEQVRAQDALERRVLERTAELEAANRELESFSYSVSHDLRAPVRAMIGFSRLLLEDHLASLDAEGRSMLERVSQSAVRMGQLIDSLLAFSHMMRQPLQHASVDISGLAAAVSGELREANPAQAVELRIAAGMRAHADPSLARSVLENLFGNAWKYTSRTPAARVEFDCLDGVFRIRDNGAGFDMRFADKLFQPFQRLHTEKEFPGVGIGLATVERIVRRHGGRVWAESAPGSGATFRFTLPD